MKRLFVPIALLAVVLAIPIVPLWLLGTSGTPWMERLVESPASRTATAAAVVGLLAADIVLPVPSSVVSTVAGNQLGFVPATLASWTGMTLGCVVAFGLARRLGRPLAARWAGPAEIARIDRLARRYGPIVLVLARGVPVLAEASVLWLGTTGLPWGWFLVIVALGNLGLSAGYAALGESIALSGAVAASLALPLLAGLLARRFWPGEEDGEDRSPQAVGARSPSTPASARGSVLPNHEAPRASSQAGCPPSARADVRVKQT